MEVERLENGTKHYIQELKGGIMATYTEGVPYVEFHTYRKIDKIRVGGLHLATFDMENGKLEFEPFAVMNETQRAEMTHFKDFMKSVVAMVAKALMEEVD